MTAAVLQERETSTAASVSSLALAFTSNVTAANAIHAIGTAADSSTQTCADSLNGTYGASLNALDDATNLQRMDHWKFNNSLGGANTVTLSLSSASTSTGIWIKEISGVTTTAFDKSAGQLQTAPTTAADALTSGATATLSAQPALVSGLSVITGAASGIPAVGTGFTDGGAGWAGISAARSENERVTGTTGVAATFTAASNVAHLTVVAVFTEAAAGSAGDPIGSANITSSAGRFIGWTT
jgi:hypothetical protein